METEDIEILIVRHLKRNTENEDILRRMIARYYALSPSYINKRHTFECLFSILKKYDLLPHPVAGQNIQYFFTDRETFDPEFPDIWDRWIHRAKVYLRQSTVAKFPRYPEPAWFRNVMRKREAHELANLVKYVRPAIYIAYYSHEGCDCYKIDVPFTQYSIETKVLCRVDEGLDVAKEKAKAILLTRIEEALSLHPTQK